MRIGMDARTLFSPQARGTGRNLRDVIRCLSVRHPSNTYFLYCRARRSELRAEREPTPGWADADNVVIRRIECPGDRLDLWKNVRLPLAAWQDRLDVLHMPANAVPWCSPVPIAATIHDLIPLGNASDGDQRGAARFENGVRRALRTAARIITPSAFTRDELVSRMGADRGRICVVPWAPDTALTAAVSDSEGSQEDARLRSEFDLRGRWILNFSGRTKRKNAARLIEAFGRLPAAICESDCLVLSGCEPESTRVELTRLTRSFGVADRCRILGFLPERDVAALLRGAAGMAMPSLAEGFGLPVLDAMACGVPVLASEATSLEEVARDAAIYVDPLSVASICRGLVRLLDDRDRAERIARGYARASTYSWERTAAALADVYDQCANDRRRAAFAEPPTGAAEGRA